MTHNWLVLSLRSVPSPNIRGSFVIPLTYLFTIHHHAHVTATAQAPVNNDKHSLTMCSVVSSEAHGKYNSSCPRTTFPLKASTLTWLFWTAVGGWRCTSPITHFARDGEHPEPELSPSTPSQLAGVGSDHSLRYQHLFTSFTRVENKARDAASSPVV